MSFVSIFCVCVSILQSFKNGDDLGRENAFFTGFSFLTLLINSDLRFKRANHRIIKNYIGFI